MIVEVSTSIACPPPDVFAFVSDMRNEPQWHPDVLDAQLTSNGAVRSGSTFHFRIKPSMGLSEGMARISEYEPPRRVTFQGQMNKMRYTLTHMVEPQGASSRFTRRIELQLAGPMRLMTPLVRPMVRKANTGFLANLKSVLESG